MPPPPLPPLPTLPLPALAGVRRPDVEGEGEDEVERLAAALRVRLSDDDDGFGLVCKFVRVSNICDNLPEGTSSDI